MKNNYTLTARVFPAIITLIPFAVIYLYVINPYVKTLIQDASTLLYGVCGVAFNAVLLYLLILVNRWISKRVFQKLFFRDEINMPTTSYLLPSNTHFDTVTKKRINDKIDSLLSIDIESDLRRLVDEENQRSYIVSVVGTLRSKLRDNQMLLQHNIEYGFVRNLIGGCVLSTFAWLFLIVYSLCTCQCGLFWTSLVFIILYLTPLFLSKVLINYFGKEYARVFYYELENL